MSFVRILIVDDNQTIRRGIRSLLSSHAGWEVSGEAADGLEAVEKTKELRPEVVLMDISMPRMNGIEATRIIRREVPDSKIIIVSQNDPTIGSRQASEIGAVGYVAKSEISRTLLPIISRVMGDGEPGGPGPGAGDSLPTQAPGNDGKPKKPEGVARPEDGKAKASKSPSSATNLLLQSVSEITIAGRARSLLAAIVDSADDAIISKNLDGKIMSWNSGAEKIFGYTAEEAIGQQIAIIIPDDRRDEEAKLMDQLMQGMRIDHFETMRRRKDGATIEVSLKISPVREVDGSIIGISNVARDIAVRRQEQHGNRLLAAVVDSSDDAIITKSLDGVITSWNGSAERMFGYTAQEAVGQHIMMIIPRDRAAEEAGILERLRQGKRIEHFETIRMRKDGTLLDISLAISPVLDANGRVVGASKVARDISERKRTDRALRESEEQLRLLAEGLETQVRIRTQELEERNAEVMEQSALLGELSNRLLKSQDDERRRIARELHDSAGQTLTALGLTLSSMGGHALNDGEFAKDLQDAQEQLQALNREIRTMSYLLHPPLLDENGLLEALRWYISGLSERSGLEIELIARDDIGRLPNEMELTLFRIVQECLTNIHRHSGSKTAIIRLQREASELSLEIQDQGRGIPTAKLANIRAQRSGVGLMGIRERVRHLRGVMTIASDERGTKISVTLPISKTAALTEELREPTRATG